MKLPSLLVILLSVAFTTSEAFADPGVNLSWDACTPEGGVQNKDFACNTNSGSRTMYGSFILANDQANFVAAEITLDLHAQSDSLPAWWQFKNAGACRSTALSISFDFSSDPGTHCTDPWNSQATGAVAGYHTYWTTPQVPSGSPSDARILAISAVPSVSPIQLSAGTEYYCFKAVISSAKTVGSGSCGGCSVPVCVLLSKISAVQNDHTQEDLTQAIASNLITWQSATECPGGNTTQNVTWGQIRSVLR